MMFCAICGLANTKYSNALSLQAMQPPPAPTNLVEAQLAEAQHARRVMEGQLAAAESAISEMRQQHRQGSPASFPLGGAYSGNTTPDLATPPSSSSMNDKLGLSLPQTGAC